MGLQEDIEAKIEETKIELGEALRKKAYLEVEYLKGFRDGMEAVLGEL